jgi:hypothetical protein
MTQVNKGRYRVDFSSQKLSKSNTIKSEALKQALKTREFEIDLYWKRANYFWTFIAAVFAGYFLLLSSDNIDAMRHLLFAISCLGFNFSLGWYLANRGSKFWQENWEKHVDWLEDDIIGPLYKTTLDTRKCKRFHLHKEYGFSVSKINQMLSLYVVFIWIFLIYDALERMNINNIRSFLISNNGIKVIVIAVITLAAVYSLLHWGRTNQQDKNNEVGFIRRRYR